MTKLTVVDFFCGAMDFLKALGKRVIILSVGMIIESGNRNI